MSEQKPSPNILIVEDEEVSKNILVALISKLNASHSTATNADEARIHLNEQKFDLVLMDVLLSGQSGLELTKEIRHKEASSREHTLIVAITSLDSKEDKQRCLEAGMDGYFAKPINRAMFLTFLKNLLK